MATTSSSPALRLRRFVALGDSFTAGGTPGEDPDAARAGVTPWPDHLAARLRAGSPELAYDNLACAGATSADVAAEQLEAALAFAPDLVTLVCGANDVLLAVRPDVPAYARTLAGMLGRLRARRPGAAIMTATTPDFSGFAGLRPRSRARVARGIAELNEATRAVARRHGVPCLELAGHPGAGARASFAADGIHPAPDRHPHIAEGFAAGIDRALPDLRTPTRGAA